MPSDWNINLAGQQGATGAPGPGGVPADAFIATLSADQSIAINTNTKVNFNTALYNQNAKYNTTTQRWTPSAGPVQIELQVYAGIGTPTPGSAITYLVIVLYKNGVSWKQFNSSGPFATMSVVDTANGTDYYEAYASVVSGTGPFGISSSAVYTFFQGFAVSPGGPAGQAGAAGPQGPQGLPGPTTPADAFVATLSADQTGIAANTWTKINFNLSGYNQNGKFNTSSSRWTPSPGPVEINAQIACPTVATVLLAIYKNGIQACHNAGTNTPTVPLTIVDNANGTDYYECWVQSNVANTVTANYLFTFFGGFAIAPQGPVGPASFPDAPSDNTLYGRQNAGWVSAAPLDAMAFNGMQINGSCDVSQENGANVVAVPGGTIKYIVDGWFAYFGNSTAVFRAFQQPAGGITNLSNCIALQATTAITTVAAGDSATFQVPIEGYRIARLVFGTANAQPVTIGFWVFASIAGTMAVSIRNAGGTRSYVTNVAITAANTWQWVTVTIPGDTAGTWVNTNASALVVTFCFCCGSTFQATPNAWQAGNLFGTASTTNFFATANNQVQITGLIVLPGIELPSAARSALIMRPYDQELLLCMRLYEKFTIQALQSPAASTMTVPYSFKVLKRSMPTVTTLTVPTYSNASGATIAGATVDMVSLQFTAGVAGGYLATWGLGADARL